MMATSQINMIKTNGSQTAGLSKPKEEAKLLKNVSK